jgi:hypothetical protein
MMFLIRTAFWLMILVLVLPTDAQQQSQVFGTAEAAVKDVTGFCDRNPSVCETGKGAFDVFVQKAQFGVAMVMGFVEGAASGTEAPKAGAPDAAATPADNGADTAPLAKGATLPWLPSDAAPSTLSQNTLTPSDLAPAWAGRDRAGS